MRPIKHLVALVVMFSLGVYSSVCGQSRKDLGRPVAVDRATDSEFYVLSADRSVRKLRVSGNALEQYGEFTVEGLPIDFTYSVSDKVASLFVCSTRSGKGVISRYALDGSLMHAPWWLWHTCGGVDFDYVDRVLYIATTDTNEIYRLNISGNSEPESVGQLASEGKIGPIAIDSVRKLIYAGDTFQGVVYEYDLAKKTKRIIASGLGSPTSLYLDSQNRLLYVADWTLKRILTVSISIEPVTRSRPQAAHKSVAAKAEIHVVVQNGRLVSPTGVVPVGAGQLAVSDSSANRVFVVSLSGEVKFQYPP